LEGVGVVVIYPFSISLFNVGVFDGMAATCWLGFENFNSLYRYLNYLWDSFGGCVFYSFDGNGV
jgi:hypothetical protein